MKVFSLWEDTLARGRPREDYSAYDEKAGVFVIADGVSLWEGIEYSGRYPKASGSGHLSQMFCKAFVHYFRAHPRSGIVSAFGAANRAAGKANRERSKYDVVRTHRNLYAATAAMGRIRGNVLEWGHVCDAGVLVIGKGGNIRFAKDGCSHRFNLPHDIDKYGPTSWTLFNRTILRNAVDKKGRPIGYGVVTGEPEAERYLEAGTYRLRPGDTAVLYSDGFAPYLELRAFRTLIASARSQSAMSEGIKRMTASYALPLRRKLKGHRIDVRASVEVVYEELQRVLGGDFAKLEFTKERSLVVARF